MPNPTEAAVLLGSRTKQELLESRLSFLPGANNVKSSHYYVHVWLGVWDEDKGTTTSDQTKPFVKENKQNPTIFIIQVQSFIVEI